MHCVQAVSIFKDHENPSWHHRFSLCARVNNRRVAIDEIQHLPTLPASLRVLMDWLDRMGQHGQFLLCCTLAQGAPQRRAHHSEGPSFSV
jgi:hypothetical protein